MRISSCDKNEENKHLDKGISLYLMPYSIPLLPILYIMYVCNWKLPYIPKSYGGPSGLYLPFDSLKSRLSLSCDVPLNRLMFSWHCPGDMKINAWIYTLQYEQYFTINQLFNIAKWISKMTNITT